MPIKTITGVCDAFIEISLAGQARVERFALSDGRLITHVLQSDLSGNVLETWHTDDLAFSVDGWEPMPASEIAWVISEAEAAHVA